MTSPQEQLRKKLAKALRQADVSEALWRHLDRRGYVDDAIQHDEFDFLVNAARDEMTYLREAMSGAVERVKGNQELVRERSPSLSDYENQRGDAFSAGLVVHATAQRDVQRIRAELFEGTLLVPHEAHRLLESPALCFMHRTHLDRLGVPLIDHRSCIVDTRVSPFSVEPIVTEVTLVLDAPSLLRPSVWIGRRTRKRSQTSVEMLEFPDRDLTSVARMPAWPHSVFDEIRKVSVSLTRRFPWQEAQATWFILTGAVPLVSPVRVRERSTFRREYHSMRISIEAEAWVSVTAIARIYRELQHQALGHPNRQLGSRTLALYEFSAQSGAHQTRSHASWRTLMREWNREHPDWLYEDVRRFARDCGRAERAVLFPGYQLTHIGKSKDSSEQSTPADDSPSRRV